MANYWAITVGINHYRSLQPLNFAQQDAQSLCEALVSEAGFLPDHCILMTDTSPEVVGRSTYPSRDNLQHWISFFKQELARPEDWVWVFFSGYGVCLDGQDYLLGIEGNPADVASTGVTMRSLFEQLSTLPTERLLLLLDINHSQGILAGENLGAQTAALAKEFSVPTLLSCRPDEFSHEVMALNQGLFTTALVEGLRSHQCSTLSGLEEFMTARLPELCNHHDRPVQHPVLVVSNPEQVYQVITPVNWAETEPWKPAIPNPFTVEDDFFDTSIMDTAPVAIEAPPASYIQDTPNAIELDSPPDPVYLPPKPVSPPRLDPKPAEMAASNAPDESLWEKVLFGGSALLLVLLLGVLWRQRDNFFGQQTAIPPAVNTSNGAQSASAPVGGVSSKGSKPAAQQNSSSATPKAVAPPANTSQQVLENARSLIKPVNASDANKAILLALKIPSSDPLYNQAQQDIERWSGDILEISQKRAQQKNYKQAIAAAQLVPRESPQIYAEAQKLIKQLQKAR
ncbi:MAG: caspase family protein [Myxacorys chilensis ATA2-1-KO14]|jgi:hypothetical protein|nr:caspase family protein [Myxacorys chilensis ATA2-1-KO14]